jgi:hypothetical protein
MKNQRNYDPVQIDRLEKYIYVLREPRDKILFCLGQGTVIRVSNHFNQADAVNNDLL